MARLWVPLQCDTDPNTRTCSPMVQARSACHEAADGRLPSLPSGCCVTGNTSSHVRTTTLTSPPRRKREIRARRVPFPAFLSRKGPAKHLRGLRRHRVRLLVVHSYLCFTSLNYFPTVSRALVECSSGSRMVDPSNRGTLGSNLGCFPSLVSRIASTTYPFSATRSCTN